MTNAMTASRRPRARARERRHQVRDEPDRQDQRGGEPGPGQRAGDEAQPVPAERRQCDPTQDEHVEGVHPGLEVTDAGASSRAWVRKPVWATMR